ncbi:Hydroxypyruvate reductase [BD1-7 clade bacterium]|uniref:Hydroxypyruvate reductase n=1 Tax=BD1-7 clade bacterium TaxID=2029982 RepID=A0A5S9QGY7_9GAMM|nr:Hydroxypyruvate reductase [BD1-7 clade bacterium]CAA0117262.1 Hydroxypyruvate reductase [BD1-7 clade bacterium]
MKVLVTCPPMLQQKEHFLPIFEKMGFEAVTPEVSQTLSETELKRYLTDVGGWIIGDDPATRDVLTYGKNTQLKACVKWGVGTDNVDRAACEELGIEFDYTPNMFGKEVADIAVGYIIGLARNTFFIDRNVRSGNWVKPTGISIAGKKVGVVGFGDIGKNTAKRLLASDMDVYTYDPFIKEIPSNLDCVKQRNWPENIESLDFLIFTCALTDKTRHMLSHSEIAQCKNGVRIVNVARGPLIDESALLEGLKTGKIHSAALDVFETEPLPVSSQLISHNYCILGSHNASNTVDAVQATNLEAITKLQKLLEIQHA